MSSLFSPYTLGAHSLRNRIVMAPMTRAPAVNLNPDATTALYYAQRASAGLIISEGLPISREARGAIYIPGIYTHAQVKAWRMVTDAVHARGGLIFAQLWHVGRASHIQHQIGGQPPVSSVAKVADAQTFVLDDAGAPARAPQSMPRALESHEMPRLVNDYVTAAQNAIDAGFDGVEIHGANGYLPEQFINGALNDRNDEYGGCIENRLRLPLEIVDGIAGAIGAGRTGIRLAPFGRFNDMHPFADEAETWLALAAELSLRKLAYVHISDQETLGAQAIPEGFVQQFRDAYQGTLIVAGGYQMENGQAALDANRADLIAIGRPFISNPDLVERFRNNWPLTPGDVATYYSGGTQGYIDYPNYK
ncbi:Morphinone reductase [Pseudomonas syringae pv. avellanae str. ISPaVe013]|uniref:alkene reductase n=1 Tax=Pseudomonas syringae TaxID=317 RepID=UPI00028C7EE3|nr:alkene reductase [Pseudomonas syringae]EKG42343.1 Morphinone reductase [Pseudomonas syringae pv. avellanae str. ISPaVe013]